jgi:hypothetical protein
MKSFLIACLAMVVFLGIIAACGPKHRYCPMEMDMECHVYDEAGAGNGGTGGMDRGPCDGGAFTPLPDGGVMCL